MPVTLARSRLLTIAVALGAIALVAVLYGISRLTVHAPLKPPASLARLVMADRARPVADVAFEGPGGKRLTLGEFRGRYVLLNLWATWCAPCVRELPALAALEQRVPQGRLSVVAVDVGRGTISDAAQFLKSHGAEKLDVYVDPDIALMRAFGAYGLPLSVLIDPEGREIARAVGPADWSAKDSVRYFERLTAAKS